MEGLERAVRTWMATGSEDEVKGVVATVVEGDATLLQVVKSLGEYLTSEEEDLRSKGVEFLSLVLAICPSENLNRQSVKVLVTFYISKLEDTDTIVPALNGLASLSAKPSFTALDAVEVVKALFLHVKMRALVQSVRFQVFTILDNMMSRHRQALKDMGETFLTGYISLADGEKDPRNLMVAFAVDRVIGIEFDITNHLESFFNVTFCYFPITFRPPPDDPYGIGADDLKGALRGVLEANPALGGMAIPLFLEKLSAGSPPTKIDTLQALASCLPIYGRGLAQANAQKIWNALRLEIFQPADDLTADEALKTTQSLIKTLYSLQDGEEPLPDGIATDICEECLKLLREPEKSQARPAIRTMCAFLTMTDGISRYTVSQCVPQLLKTFNDPDEYTARPQVLALLAQFTEATKAAAPVADGRSPLVSYKDELLGAFTVGLASTSSRDPALVGLKSLVTNTGLLSDEETRYAVHNVNETIETSLKEDVEISDDVLDLLTCISSTTPKYVQEMTLPILFHSLPDAAPARTAEKARVRTWQILAALKTLCLQQALFETLVVRLLAKLDLVCLPSPNQANEEKEADREASAAYAHAMLHTLFVALEAKATRGDADVAKYAEHLLPQLFNLFIAAADSVAMEPRLIAVAARIVTLVVQTLQVERQQKLVDALFAAYTTGQVGLIAHGHRAIPADHVFRPFEAEATTSQKNLVLLLAAAVVALRKEVTIPSEPTPHSVLLWSIERADNTLQREASWHMIASMLNKQAEKMQEFIAQTGTDVWERVINGGASTEIRQLAICAWTWITRALLVRNHPDAMAHVDRLFTLFNDEDMNWAAARALGAIASNDNVLTKRNHAVLRLLYAHKYCNALLPRILEGAKTPGDPALQNTYLVALTSLITALPKSTYASEMPSLMPLLLRGLDLPDLEIRTNVIHTLTAAAEGNAEAIQGVVGEHATTLVMTMLRNSLASDVPSARVRAAALRYLALLPDIVRYDVLHPQKSTVIRELAKVLDDPKRSVRTEAVNARSRWFTYSG